MINIFTRTYISTMLYKLSTSFATRQLKSKYIMYIDLTLCLYIDCILAILSSNDNKEEKIKEEIV